MKFKFTEAAEFLKAMHDDAGDCIVRLVISKDEATVIEFALLPPPSQ